MKRVTGIGGIFFKSENPAKLAAWYRDMVNFRVDDLDAVLEALKAEGCQVDEKRSDDPDFGRFGWVMDPEGTRIELWEPPKSEVEG